MTNDVAEARAALLDVERRRRRVIDEIDVPAWYWWMLAGGWLVLGVVGDLTPVAVSAVATLVFGAVHAAIAPGCCPVNTGVDGSRCVVSSLIDGCRSTCSPASSPSS